MKKGCYQASSHEKKQLDQGLLLYYLTYKN